MLPFGICFSKTLQTSPLCGTQPTELLACKGTTTSINWSGLDKLQKISPSPNQPSEHSKPRVDLQIKRPRNNLANYWKLSIPTEFQFRFDRPRLENNLLEENIKTLEEVNVKEIIEDQQENSSEDRKDEENVKRKNSPPEGRTCFDSEMNFHEFSILRK